MPSCFVNVELHYGFHIFASKANNVVYKLYMYLYYKKLMGLITCVVIASCNDFTDIRH